MCKHRYIEFILICLLTLTGCEQVNYSPIPKAPVQLTINTEAGAYVHFVTANIGEYIIVDGSGYHYHGQTLPLTNTDYYGYAGTLIYITHDQHYAAFDLCCPHCIKREPCYVDGFYVICPICGERYDVSHGFGTPTQSISKQALRKYSAIYTNHRLTIRD